MRAEGQPVVVELEGEEGLLREAVEEVRERSVRSRFSKCTTNECLEVGHYRVTLSLYYRHNTCILFPANFRNDGTDANAGTTGEKRRHQLASCVTITRMHNLNLV